MPLNGAQPNQFGQSTLNLWAMIKAMVANKLGWAPISGTPTDGTTGSYAKYAGPGFMLFDVTTGIVYTNRSLVAGSPVWAAINTPPAGLGGLGNVGVAKMTYSFAANGGAISTITPANSPTLPAGAIVFASLLEVVTIAASGGAATIAFGFGSGAQVASLLAATAYNNALFSGTGIKAMVPVFTAASAVKVAAETRMTMTIAGATLTDGVFDVNALYVRGNV